MEYIYYWGALPLHSSWATIKRFGMLPLDGLKTG